MIECRRIVDDLRLGKLMAEDAVRKFAFAGGGASNVAKWSECWYRRPHGLLVHRENLPISEDMPRFNAAKHTKRNQGRYL